MAADKQAAEWCEDFVGAALAVDLSEVSTNNSTLTMGGGKVTAALTADSEAQCAGFAMGDKLAFDIDELQRIEMVVELPAALAAGVTAAFGVCSARADAIDSVAEGAWFRINGASTPSKAVVVESDDGTNDVSVSSGRNVEAATATLFVLDFRNGLQHKLGANSKGGKAAVRAYFDDARGNLREVDLGGTFLDLSNYAGGLQVFAQIRKASGTATGSLVVHSVKAEYLKKR